MFFVNILRSLYICRIKQIAHPNASINKSYVPLRTESFRQLVLLTVSVEMFVL